MAAESERPTPAEGSFHRCELCGSPVRVASSDEGTNYYEPAEDWRERWENLVQEAVQAMTSPTWQHLPSEGEAPALIRSAAAALQKAEADLVDMTENFDHVSGDLIVEIEARRVAETEAITAQRRVGELLRGAAPIDVELLRNIMFAIEECSEEEDENGLCPCAKVIGQELQRFEWRADRFKKRMVEAETELDRLKTKLSEMVASNNFLAEQVDTLTAEARNERIERWRLADALTAIKLRRVKSGDTPCPCDDQAWWIASGAIETKEPIEKIVGDAVRVARDEYGPGG